MRGTDPGHHHQSSRHSVSHDDRPFDRMSAGQSVVQQGRNRRRHALQRRRQRVQDLFPPAGVRLQPARQ